MTGPGPAGPVPRRRRTFVLLIVIGALVLTLAGVDASRPPSAQWSARVAIAAIHEYQRHGSPVLARLGLRCRFKPTCSHYAAVVIARDGIVRGGWRALERVARCGPWTPMGTVDPP